MNTNTPDGATELWIDNEINEMDDSSKGKKIVLKIISSITIFYYVVLFAHVHTGA